MNESFWYNEHKTAIHLLRSGLQADEVARQMNRSRSWVYKWWKRFGPKQDWNALHVGSRAPKHCARRMPEHIALAVRQARSELESEAAQPGHLKYIGARAVQARLADKQVIPLPSTASIERILRASGMTRPKPPDQQSVKYPQLQPTRSHQLCQIDIVPQYLKGGQSVACFNALDVVSRYPSGQQWLSKRSQEAVDFICQVWKEMGISDYTQLDNESCFSGGFTHPGVLGRVVRLGLYVGTELVFTPHYHPESNGHVERFHQDYLRQVWADTDLQDLKDVRQHSQGFFRLYRRSRHHSALQGCSPAERHNQDPMRKLPEGFQPLTGKLPLTVGQVHFIRKVSQARTVSILNLDWMVSNAEPGQGVWATLRFTLQGARLRVYDAAPDALRRTCLVEHPFPLNEPVQPLQPRFQKHPTRRSWLTLVGQLVRHTISNRVVAGFLRCLDGSP